MTKPKLALQLYTVRDAMEQDFDGTLARVAEIGFTHVETAFFPDGVSIVDAAASIKRAGLTVCSAHCEIPVGDQQSAVIEMVDAFDCDRIVWHGWPQDPDYSTSDGTKRLAALYNQANEICQANGKRFGVHNHWWEFQLHPTLIDGGKRPYQILAEEMEPSIFYEIDAYWAQTAGVDPADVLQELGTRAPLVHVKDGPAMPGTEEDDMVALGQGGMDFVNLTAAFNGNVEWLIIELDRCATDMLDAVAESYQFLTKNRFVA